MLRRSLFGFIFAVGIIFLSVSIYPDEGMWPISEIGKLDLQSRGLEIAPDEVFSLDKLSLVQAVVQVGATGSFVSNDGLIITNHHVAYGAVQAASTKEKDYIQHGFLARDRSKEIRAEGLTARITESYKDVSEEVLSVIKQKMGYAERTKAVEQRIKKIVVEEEKKNLVKEWK